ncbi:MAG: transposase [Planctomycetia bacterium]|nr:transposase [Planctomycetia bacterium]
MVDATFTHVPVRRKPRQNVDVGSKMIRNFCVCSVNEHGSRHFEELLDPKSRSRKVYADSAYVGKTHEDQLIEMKFSPQICERSYRNQPLTKTQKKRNRKKSHTRIRVEHVFGQMSQFCRGRRTIHVLGLM